MKENSNKKPFKKSSRPACDDDESKIKPKAKKIKREKLPEKMR